MQTLKVYFILILVVGGSGLLGYWAVTTLTNPVPLAIETEEPEEYETNIDPLQEDIFEEVEPVVVSPVVEQPEEVQETNPNADLIKNLNLLASKGIYMKQGDTGANVGIIQKFLNVYNKTSNKIDNDYGAETKAKVIEFQKKVGITADGETGPQTYKKMVEELE